MESNIIDRMTRYNEMQNKRLSTLEGGAIQMLINLGLIMN